MSAPTALLLAYHDPSHRAALGALPEKQLADMSNYGRAAWPAVAVLTARMLKDPSSEVLDALRAHGPRAVTHIPPTDLRTLDAPATALFQQVIDQPADYPRGWVWAAQETLSRQYAVGARTSPHPYLADVASNEGWFSAQ